jgi:hypothetical protein
MVNTVPEKKYMYTPIFLGAARIFLGVGEIVNE